MQILKKYLKQARERVPRKEYQILEKSLYHLGESYEKWKQRLRKGCKGENIVYKALTDEGYDIWPFPRVEEGRISLERKIEKAREPRYPDAHAVCLGEELAFGRHFLFDPKFKTRLVHLGIVNKIDYVGYWKQHQLKGYLDVPFYIFFYVKETNEIWFHRLRDPKAEPNLEKTIAIQRNGKETYRIPRKELTLWKRLS